MIESESLSKMERLTKTLVDQAFIRSTLEGKPRFSIGSNDWIENNHSLGSVTETNDELLIRVGLEEINTYTEELGIEDEQVDAVTSFVGLAMYAGTIVVKNILENQVETPELRAVFDEELQNPNGILMALQMNDIVGIEDESHYLAVATSLRKLDEQDRSLIETVNIQRIGASIVVEVAKMNSNDLLMDAALSISRGLDDNIYLAQLDARLLGAPTGRYTTHLSSAYQRFIGMRGFGFAIPMAKDELLDFRKKLIDANKSDEQLASLTHLFDDIGDDICEVDDTFNKHQDHTFFDGIMQIVE